MLKPQKKKYRVFARDFDRKPEIIETDEIEEVMELVSMQKWITITIELKTSEKHAQQ